MLSNEKKFQKSVVGDQLKIIGLTALARAIITVESNGNKFAVSKAGAKGLMQLMPQILSHFGVKNAFNAKENIRAGMALLEEELERYGDIELALAAYNAGSPQVNKAIEKAGRRDFEGIKRCLPMETQEYVPKVLRLVTLTDYLN